VKHLCSTRSNFTASANHPGLSFLFFAEHPHLPNLHSQHRAACVDQPCICFSSPDMDSEINPKEFAQRIRELGAERDQQDAERVKKLEEDLIQGRSERLARRAGVLTCLVMLARDSPDRR